MVIRNLDPAVKKRLRVQAARHGHSIEAEARQILELGVCAPEPSPEDNLYDRVRARLAPLGGVDLNLPDRKHQRPHPLPRFD